MTLFAIDLSFNWLLLFRSSFIVSWNMCHRHIEFVSKWNCTQQMQCSLIISYYYYFCKRENKLMAMFCSLSNGKWILIFLSFFHFHFFFLFVNLSMTNTISTSKIIPEWIVLVPKCHSIHSDFSLSTRESFEIRFHVIDEMMHRIEFRQCRSNLSGFWPVDKHQCDICFDFLTKFSSSISKPCNSSMKFPNHWRMAFSILNFVSAMKMYRVSVYCIGTWYTVVHILFL